MHGHGTKYEHAYMQSMLVSIAVQDPGAFYLAKLKFSMIAHITVYNCF